MSDDIAASYDRILYPGSPTSETHPDRLATVARLFGMQPAPPSRCRMLELGCGVGGNLISLAYLLPESEFVGIDISPHSIEIGNRNVAALGLKNLALRHCDIMQITEEFGQFDYIVAHGVYSWVPQFVRERVLSLYKMLLKPQGVGYVSYNASPGGHLRWVARDMMLFHARDFEDPSEQVEQSIALLQFVAGAAEEDETHGAIVRDQLERIGETKPEVVYHDDLLPSATPFMLHQVAEAAAKCGLQYLGDARFGRTQLFGLPAEIVELIEQVPKSEAVEREQYADFSVGRAFRATLLCHEDVVLDRDIQPERLRHFLIAADVTPASEIPLAPGVAKFKGERDATIETDDPLGKAALVHLGTVWPQSVAFEDLLAASIDRLQSAGMSNGSERDEQLAVLASLLLRAYAAGHVVLHSEAPRLVANVSLCPRASLLARKLAEAGPALANLRHNGIMLRDPVTRGFLALLDGTRTIDDLVAELNTALAASIRATKPDGAFAEPPKVTRQQVEENLRLLARLALLEA